MLVLSWLNYIIQGGAFTSYLRSSNTIECSTGNSTSKRKRDLLFGSETRKEPPDTSQSWLLTMAAMATMTLPRNPIRFRSHISLPPAAVKTLPFSHPLTLSTFANSLLYTRFTTHTVTHSHINKHTQTQTHPALWPNFCCNCGNHYSGACRHPSSFYAVCNANNGHMTKYHARYYFHDRVNGDSRASSQVSQQPMPRQFTD